MEEAGNCEFGNGCLKFNLCRPIHLTIHLASERVMRAEHPHCLLPSIFSGGLSSLRNGSLPHSQHIPEHIRGPESALGKRIAYSV